MPTFIEVKRASDTRSRREVVAQMLDYAANGSRFWAPEQLRSWFEGDDPKGAVNRLADWLGRSEDEPEVWPMSSGKRPEIPLAELTDGRAEHLLALVDRWLEEVRAYAAEPETNEEQLADRGPAGSPASGS